MFTKRQPRRHEALSPVPRNSRNLQASTLVELLMAVGVGSTLLTVIMSLVLYSARSYAALVNYVDLDNLSRNALDQMTMEIRQADRLVSGDATSMRYRFTNPTNALLSWEVNYVYSPDSRTLARLQGLNRTVLLEECDFLEFSYFRRNPATNGFDLWLTANPPLVDPSICKAVQMRWICSRTIMQQAVNTESVQSARIVIRKK
jgi:hypothetical protein